jgi:hypothetical protein
MADKPDFETAISQFKVLLGKCQYAKSILWVTPRDVILPGRRLVYIKIPVPTSNETEARKTYQEGIAQGRGLLISTLCEMPESTCCFLWYPRNVDEVPQGNWPHDGLFKMSAETGESRISGKGIRNRFLWTALGICYRSQQSLNDAALWWGAVHLFVPIPKSREVVLSECGLWDVVGHIPTFP